MELEQFYQYFVAPQLNLIGDQATQLQSLTRLRSLGICHCRVLVNMTEQEIVTLWSTPNGIYDNLAGPGIARSFVSELREMISQRLHQPQHQHPIHMTDPSSPGLAGALESLASAAQRLKRERKPYDHDLDSSEEEVFFDLGSVLDQYQLN